MCDRHDLTMNAGQANHSYGGTVPTEVPAQPVKAVSDWGVGKTDAVQAAAARNAADFVVRMVSEGALDPHTWQSRHTS